MKRTWTISLVAVAAGFAIYACSPKFNTVQPAASLTEKLNTIINDWASMTPAYNELCYSALPELGVRVRYERAKSELALTIVEGIVGKKAFLKGPHTDGIDCSSATFGYYNPAFLMQLKAVLKTTLDNKIFVDKFQPFYDAELKGLFAYFLSFLRGGHQ